METAGHPDLQQEEQADDQLHQHIGGRCEMLSDDTMAGAMAAAAITVRSDMERIVAVTVFVILLIFLWSFCK